MTAKRLYRPSFAKLEASGTCSGSLDELAGDFCRGCGHCREHCPYELDTPALLKMMLADYEAFLETLPKS